MDNKKTVAYLTRHTVSNYGSVLQAYATQTALEKLGCNAVCINYYRTDEKTENIVDTRLKSVSAKWNKNALTRLFFKATQKPVYKFADKRFEEYRKIVKVTDKEYNSEAELKSDIPKADIYMTGSDQVWNTVVCGEIDPVYFLSFLPKKVKKIAYAASFGGASVEEKNKTRIKSWLEEYDKVTIRENSGIKIASELGIHAEQVLDPL